MRLSKITVHFILKKVNLIVESNEEWIIENVEKGT